MLNKKEIINKLTTLRSNVLEDIIKQEISSKSNNVKCERIAHDNGFVDALETVLSEIYDYHINE